MVACKFPTSTVVRKKNSCASGTVHLKDHSRSSIRWKSGKIHCADFFFQFTDKDHGPKIQLFSPTVICCHMSNTPRIHISLYRLLSFCRPCIFVFAQGAFHAKSKHMIWFSIVPSYFYYKPFKVACIFLVFILLEIGLPTPTKLRMRPYPASVRLPDSQNRLYTRPCSINYTASAHLLDSQNGLYTRPMFNTLPSQPSGFPKPSLYSAHVLYITQPALRIPKTVFILGPCFIQYPASPPDSQNCLYTRPMLYTLPNQCSQCGFQKPFDTRPMFYALPTQPSGFQKPALYRANVLSITQPVLALRIPKTVFILGNCSIQVATSLCFPSLFYWKDVVFIVMYLR